MNKIKQISAATGRTSVAAGTLTLTLGVSLKIYVFAAMLDLMVGFLIPNNGQSVVVAEQSVPVSHLRVTA